jgi:uncharacterized protein YjcR
MTGVFCDDRAVLDCKGGAGRGQKRYSKEDRYKCQVLYQQRNTPKQIAAMTGIKAVTIRSWIRKERWNFQEDEEGQM